MEEIFFKSHMTDTSFFGGPDKLTVGERLKLLRSFNRRKKDVDKAHDQYDKHQVEPKVFGKSFQTFSTPPSLLIASGFRLQGKNGRQISPQASVVQAVADNKLVGNGKTSVIHLNLHLAPVRLVQKDTCPQ
jgi:hypothetical protein